MLQLYFIKFKKLYNGICMLTSSQVCPHCSCNTREILLCGNCGRIMPISSDVNYFDLFSLELQFEVSRFVLEDALIRLLKIFHPDKFVFSSKLEKEIALRNSSLINTAYGVLIDPIKRAGYILKQHGYSLDNSVSEEISSATQDLLLLSMEWQERLEDEDEDKSKLKSEILFAKDQILKLLKDMLNSALYDEALKQYMKLKFINRFLERI